MTLVTYDRKYTEFTIGRLIVLEWKYEAVESMLLESQSMRFQGDERSLSLYSMWTMMFIKHL